jgi:hypothetical protein
MHLIRVLNKKHGATDEYIGREYIGRPSPLGNPFPLRRESERDEVIDKYAKWLNQKLTEKTNNAQKKEIVRLYKKLVANGELNLVCWCAPKKCHGDVIKNVLVGLLKRNLYNK